MAGLDLVQGDLEHQIGPMGLGAHAEIGGEQDSQIELIDRLVDGAGAMVGGQGVLDREPLGGPRIPGRHGEAIELGTVLGWRRVDRYREVERAARPVERAMVLRSRWEYHSSRAPFKGAGYPFAILRRGSPYSLYPLEPAESGTISKGRGSDPVAAVARASHLRMRRVLLSGPWWRRDNGPLLGFRSADEHPVALLPVSPSGYELIDPVAQTRDLVTAAVASEVRSFGYTFYRPFPPRALTLWDVMRLGFSGGVRDVLTMVLVGTVGGLLGMLPPIVMGWIFDAITPGLARSELIPILFALGFGAMAGAFLRLVQGVAILRVQTRAEGAVEAGLWDRLLNLPASFFRVYSSGDLATRAMGISAIRQVLTEVAWTTLVSLLFSLVSFGLLIVYDVRLAVLTARS